MSEHWRTRGHGVGWFLWRRLSFCPRLRTAAMWLLHHAWLAYWIKDADGRWRRVA